MEWLQIWEPCRSFPTLLETNQPLESSAIREDGWRLNKPRKLGWSLRYSNPNKKWKKHSLKQPNLSLPNLQSLSTRSNISWDESNIRKSMKACNTWQEPTAACFSQKTPWKPSVHSFKRKNQLLPNYDKFDGLIIKIFVISHISKVLLFEEWNWC